MQMDIPDELVRRLEALAQQQNMAVDEVLKRLLDAAEPAPTGSLAEMARNARQVALASIDQVDTAERSRDILQSEYTDYVKRRNI